MTVNAPYPARMDEIDDGSIIAMTKIGNDVVLYSRGGDAVSAFEVQDDTIFNYGSISELSSFDSESREVVVRDWYRPTFPNQKNSTPSTVATDCVSVSWSPDGKYLSASNLAYHYIRTYKRSGNTFAALANPAVFPAGATRECAWDPTGEFLAVVHEVSPYVTIYQRSGDTLTKVGNPPDLPTGTGYALSWGTHDGQPYLAILHGGSRNITIYFRNGPVFNKMSCSLPVAPGPTFTAAYVSWSPNGEHLVVGYDTVAFFTVYKVAIDLPNQLVTLTKITTIDPLPNPSTICGGAHWSPSGQYLAVSDGNKVVVYKRSGDIFTRLGSPTTDLESAGYGVGWSPDGRYLAAGHTGSSRFLTVFRRKNDVITQIPDPDDAPTNVVNDVRFSPDGKYLAAACAGSDFVSIYLTANGPLGGPAARTVLAP